MNVCGREKGLESILLNQVLICTQNSNVKLTCRVLECLLPSLCYRILQTNSSGLKYKQHFINCTTQVCRVTQAHQQAVARNPKKGIKKAALCQFLCVMAGWVSMWGDVLYRFILFFTSGDKSKSSCPRVIYLLYFLVNAMPYSLHAYRTGCDSTCSHLASVCCISCCPLAAIKCVLAWCCDSSSQKPLCGAYYFAVLSPGCVCLSNCYPSSLSSCTWDFLPKFSSH